MLGAWTQDKGKMNIAPPDASPMALLRACRSPGLGGYMPRILSEQCVQMPDMSVTKLQSLPNLMS